MSNTDKAKDQELTTEEKAEQIGKDIGVEKEPVPEYDIQAEDEAPKETEVEDDSDKRLGKTREEQRGEKTEKKELSNREKRQLRKQRLAAKFDAKDAIINQLQEQLNATVARLNEVDGKLTSYDKNQLEGAMRDTNGFLAQAQKDYTDAFNAGDAAKSAQAMERMYEAKERIKALQGIAARQNAQPKQQSQPAQSQVNPAVVSKAQSWAAENPWYKADASDEDSELAQRIAERLIKEGFDATTDDYWDEFDDRLAARGIGRRNDADDEQQEQTQSEQIKQETRPAPRRRSPPVNSGSNRGDIGGGRQTVTLPTALIQHMKESGAWDDPVRKHKIIKDYQRVKAEEKR